MELAKCRIWMACERVTAGLSWRTGASQERTPGEPALRCDGQCNQSESTTCTRQECRLYQQAGFTQGFAAGARGPALKARRADIDRADPTHYVNCLCKACIQRDTTQLSSKQPASNLSCPSPLKRLLRVLPTHRPCIQEPG